MTSVSFMFVTTAFVASAVIRDDETGYGPIVRSTPLTKRDYLLGRFVGAFAVAALGLLLLPLAIVLGSMMPWADPATIGPNRLGHHLYGYVLIALPNLFVHSAVFFALATTTRSMMATYLGVLGFMSAFFVIQGAMGSTAALLDPFALRALDDAVEYWTPAERNVMLPELAGVLLHNRLLWMGVAIGCLALAYRVHRFADTGISRRERKRLQLTERASQHAVGAPVGTTPPPVPQHGPAALRALLWMRTRFEVKQVVLHPAFAILITWASYVMWTVLLTQRALGYPTTRSLLPQIDGPMTMLLSIIAIHYAGELVWRERDRRMDAIIDATPMPSWAYHPWHAPGPRHEASLRSAGGAGDREARGFRGDPAHDPRDGRSRTSRCRRRRIRCRSRPATRCRTWCAAAVALRASSRAYPSSRASRSSRRATRGSIACTVGSTSQSTTTPATRGTSTACSMRSPCHSTTSRRTSVPTRSIRHASSSSRATSTSRRRSRGRSPGRRTSASSMRSRRPSTSSPAREPARCTCCRCGSARTA